MNGLAGRFIVQKSDFAVCCDGSKIIVVTNEKRQQSDLLLRHSPVVSAVGHSYRSRYEQQLVEMR
jgi:hypothetical protein